MGPLPVRGNSSNPPNKPRRSLLIIHVLQITKWKHMEISDLGQVMQYQEEKIIWAFESVNPSPTCACDRRQGI